jgi:predicted kinase
MPTLFVLVGLPGSGKSTYIEEKNLRDNYTILSTDDIIQSVADTAGVTYNEAFSDNIKSATKHVNSLAERARENNNDVVWDQTNLTAKKRKKILDKFPGYQCIAVTFECPEEIRQERLKSRPGKTIPKHVDDSMKENFEAPKWSEGFDRLLFVMS